MYDNHRIKTIRILLEGLKSSPSEHNESVAFFRSNKLLMSIWLIILDHYYQKKKCSIECLIKHIPTEFASRPTIYKQIEIAISKSFIVKKKDENDQRVHDLYPTKRTINEYEEWVNKFNEVV